MMTAWSNLPPAPRAWRYSWWRAGLAAALVALGGACWPARAQTNSPVCWQAQNIYQVITDRFYDGDEANNNADGNYQPDGRTSVHGGDFKGLEQKLDYLKALGVTALWLSPVVLNGHGQFHGYAARDFYRVDPHWGSLADLQRLVRAAHAKGLLVIDDIVCNHGDDLITSGDPGYGGYVAPPHGYRLQYASSTLTYAPPFDVYNNTCNRANNELTNLFHNQGCIGDFSDLNQVRLGELAGLDDFRTESPYVRSNLAAIYEYWIQAAEFDGFRIDTVKHVEPGFWQYWCPRVRQFAARQGKPDFFMFGEVLDASETLCGSYTGTAGGGAYELDSVLDYPLYFLINRVFAATNGAPGQLDRHYAGVAARYDPGAQMRLVTFLDNHDQPRFLHDSTTNRLQLALVFLYTARGVPCLYYGTEQGFNGATDPDDREDMFAGQFKDSGQAGTDSFNMTHPLFQLVARLNNFRRLYPALALGAQISRWSTASGPGLYAYSRCLGEQEVLVVLNTAASAQTLPPVQVSHAPGTAWANLLNLQEIISVDGASNTPPLAVPAAGAKIFIPQSQMRPLDPVVTTSDPPHDATGVSPLAPVVLEFSQPMDASRVQAAFSVSPPADGTFAWGAGNGTLTFTPGGRGFAEHALISVRIEAAAAAVSGRALNGAYELRFKTGAAK